MRIISQYAEFKQEKNTSQSKYVPKTKIGDSCSFAFKGFEKPYKSLNNRAFRNKACCIISGSFSERAFEDLKTGGRFLLFPVTYKKRKGFYNAKKIKEETIDSLKKKTSELCKLYTADEKTKNSYMGILETLYDNIPDLSESIRKTIISGVRKVPIINHDVEVTYRSISASKVIDLMLQQGEENPQKFIKTVVSDTKKDEPIKVKEFQEYFRELYKY